MIIGGIELGNLPNYLFFFANGQSDANWQASSKGYVGNVAVDGIQASERTSGTFPYAGTITTNDATLGAWNAIITANPTQSTGVTGQTGLISGLEADLANAFSQINALAATPGYTSVSSTSLNGLNTQNGISEVYVINVTSGLNFSTKINITGDAGDVFILRWDTDGNPTNGYQGIVKPQSGGAIVPLGGLMASNFINVAGDINASGGGTTPAPPYPQGPRFNDGQGSLILGGSDFSGGGFFTGYWLTTGDPATGETQPLSNAIFVGGWYTTTTKFSMTSGTSGVYVSPNPATTTTTITGKVTDKESGDPVCNAKVELLQNHIFVDAVYTDISGEYAFTDAVSGDYRMQVTKCCYLPLCHCTEATPNNVYNFSLEPDCICSIKCNMTEAENELIAEKERVYTKITDYLISLPFDPDDLWQYTQMLCLLNSGIAKLDCCIADVLSNLITCLEDNCNG